MRSKLPALISAAAGSVALALLIAGAAWGLLGYEAEAALWLGVKAWLALNAVTLVVAVGASAVGQYSAASRAGADRDAG